MRYLLDIVRIDRCLQDALPPAYSDHVQHTQIRSSGSTELQPPSKPTNFLSLILKDKHIRGSYVINPLMQIPLSLLPPLNAGETDQDRKNLYLRTKDGNINADIWLIGQEEAAPKNKRRTTLSLSSNDGHITAKINTVKVVAPFLLDIYARDGRVTVLLPRSFHGPLLLITRESAKLSDELVQRSMTLSTLEHMQRYFVGDFSHQTFGDDWNGDELKVVSRDGSVTIRYTDEVELPKSGFFSRIFSS
ncbi:uncharacterized protein EDB91DRAFT_811312 [Suillus paluster]|uniref:uncharacterized protein n=1 Tax=Suillus paluster TaxID=48578 RepID=UPI001B884625|nr:uncharacterized protein EDB91DRAFT_811312 [Suillus paluster]KAG1729511.1 hypothetical protein EDB91DRAFT_811312 [Suillus paluster]